MPDFPTAEDRCERCGYPLVDLRLDDTCPECGTPTAESDPVHRTEPAWQSRLTPTAWLTSVAAMASRPGPTFRQMRLDGSNLPPRLFLLTMSGLAGLIWGLGLYLALGQPGVLAWLYGMGAVKGVLALTYLEVLGVAFFSRMHGWALGFRRAERVGCYASVGWLPASVFMLGFLVAMRQPGVQAWWAGSVPEPWQDAGLLILIVLVFSLTIMGFETLVWLGARRVRYGNTVSP